tara:strand:- start:218 stop:1243 length:1026 start_codon:yes stop_codon:yes gene_type:complete
MTKKIKMIQYGTKHGHAEGVLEVILNNPNVNFAGVFEPDKKRICQLQEIKNSIWNKVNFLEDKSFLHDSSIVAASCEGSNLESLDFTEELISNNKHVFYDKPGGNNKKQFLRLINLAKKQKNLLQLGYMFRDHDGFEKILEISKSNIIGDIFQIRSHMSTKIPEKNPEGMLTGKEGISSFEGGIFFDLASHMIDQIISILGVPERMFSFLKPNQNIKNLPNFKDNTLGVLEFKNALATIEITASEINPLARRFEVYGTKGYIILEPFEPANNLKLYLENDENFYKKGLNTINLENRTRYKKSFEGFIDNIINNSKPKRSLEHEKTVQEVLLSCIENNQLAR